MVVNKLLFVVAVTVFMTFGHTQEIPKNDAVNIFLDQQVKYALGELGAKMKICNQAKETNPLAISFRELEELNITVEQFTVATMKLNYRNDTQCIEAEERRFLYQFLVQYKEKKAQGKVEKDALAPMLMLLPFSEVLKALSQYDTLPTEVKKYFEKTIGIKPFDIVKTSLPILKSFRK